MLQNGSTGIGQISKSSDCVDLTQWTTTPDKAQEGRNEAALAHYQLGITRQGKVAHGRSGLALDVHTNETFLSLVVVIATNVVIAGCTSSGQDEWLQAALSHNLFAACIVCGKSAKACYCLELSIGHRFQLTTPREGKRYERFDAFRRRDDSEARCVASATFPFLVGDGTKVAEGQYCIGSAFEISTFAVGDNVV